MGFCFAQRFHPAMRFVGPVRKELGVPTVFNFLGPLTNPARVRHQLVGVSDPAMAPIMAGVLGATGSRRAADRARRRRARRAERDVALERARVCGDGSGRVRRHRAGGWTRRRWGSPRPRCGTSQGGDAAFNAGVIRSVLEGEQGARRDIGVLNAAAALLVAGRVDDLEAGVALATESVESGRALAVLDALVATSQDALRRQSD